MSKKNKEKKDKKYDFPLRVQIIDKDDLDKVTKGFRKIMKKKHSEREDDG